MSEACPENRKENLECKTALRSETLIPKIFFFWHSIIPDHIEVRRTCLPWG